MEHFNPIIGDPVADSAALLRRLAFFLLFLVLPVATIIGRRTLVIIVPVTVALLVIAAILDGNHPPVGQTLKHFLLAPGTLLGILFFGWCVLSLLWSPYLEDGFQRAIGSASTIAMIIVGYLVLPERMRSSNLYLLPIGVGIAALLAVAIELAFLSENRFISLENIFQRGLLVLVLLFWPAIAWLRSRQRDVAALALTLAIITVLFFAPHETALWAFAIGALGYAAVRIFPDKGPRLIAGITAGLLAFAPLLPFILQPIAALLPYPEFAASLEVARKIILSNPMQIVAGEGFEAATRARIAGVLDFRTPTSTLFQIWYELGIVGAWSVAAIIFIVISKAGRKYAPLAPGMIAGFLSAYVFACMGSGSVQSWWTTALASTVLIFVAMTRGQFRTKRPRIFIVNG